MRYSPGFEMQLTDLFDLSLVGRRDLPALDVDTADGRVRTLTFGDVDLRARRLARVLVARGVRPGDRVAVHLANRLEFIDLFLACLRVGAIFVPMNVLYRDRELSHILADADPALVVASAATADVFRPGVPLADIDDLTREAATSTALEDRAALDGQATAALVYTSGTTGRSKGAALSHHNFLANTVNLTACWRISHEDRYLATLPLFHVHGLANGVCTWLASGCRMRLVERFDHRRIAALFDEFQPSLFFGVPTIYVRLLDLPAATAQRIGRHVRLFVSGSAPLPASVFEDFQARFHHTILERYGMSETLMLTSNPYVGDRRAGTVGRPLPGVSLRVVGPDDRPLPPGETGSVQVRGSNVCAGYWRNDEATAAAFVDGWFRTGDLGDLSDDGYLTLRGRASDLIISGGFNIYPREIEDVLLDVPGVREAAVAGVADGRRGEVPEAWVVADDPFDPDTARAACARQLASFKVPRTVHRIDALPRNAMGKIQKHRLTE